MPTIRDRLRNSPDRGGPISAADQLALGLSIRPGESIFQALDRSSVEYLGLGSGTMETLTGAHGLGSGTLEDMARSSNR